MNTSILNKYADISEKDWLGEENILGWDRLWRAKYRRNNETFAEWLDRVSGNNLEIADLIYEKKIFFGGRIFANRGIDEKNSSLANCYVLPIGDSLDDIYQAAKESAKTYAAGGGVGINLSPLRPAAAQVHNSSGCTGGPVSFAELFDKTTAISKQNGRNGALILLLDDSHPDLLSFISMKHDTSKITNANISVAISNAFMNAVHEDADWTLSFKTPYETITSTVPARQIFDAIVQEAWETGEPGLIFIDHVNNFSLVSEYADYHISATNPCGELPLIPYGACCLGSLNVSSFLLAESSQKTNSLKTYSNEYAFDCYCKKYPDLLEEAKDELEEFIDFDFDFCEFGRVAWVFFRELIKIQLETIDRHPLKKQKKVSEEWREIGGGLFGFHEALIKMGIHYGSQKSKLFLDILMAVFQRAAITASCTYALEIGTFPTYKYELISKSKYFKSLPYDLQDLIKENGLANSHLLAIAPTGSLSNMVQSSGGLEPFFSIKPMGRLFTDPDSGEKREYLVGPDLPGVDLDAFGTAHDIAWKTRISMQAIAQSYVDSAISSTVNLPENTTPEEVADLFRAAFYSGCKGITIFRDNCLRQGLFVSSSPDGSQETNQLKTLGEKDKEDKEDKEEDFSGFLARGEECEIDWENEIAKIQKLNVACGSLYLHSLWSIDDGRLLSFFVSKGSKGSCSVNLNAVSRFASLALRLGASIEQIIDQGMSAPVCPACSAARARGEELSVGTGCPSIIAFALRAMAARVNEEYGFGVVVDFDSLEGKPSRSQNYTTKDARDLKGGGDEFEPFENSNSFHSVKMKLKQENTLRKEAWNLGFTCPDCGEKLFREGGCLNCKYCGYSKC